MMSEESRPDGFVHIEESRNDQLNRIEKKLDSILYTLENEELSTSVGTEVEEITVTSNISINENEFNQLLENAPHGFVTDDPLPLKPCNASKEFDDNQF
ncbi:hypothetical protein KHA93_03030 [Bacillus sp. FJAT-49732]|uniref:Uncharacterized protein n=1 Tax=Lederbergia citrisecunda TaxID=2833583 RepID=A0A942TMD4_9BACI|nr:hypothetical protein [Lederbergia citrisecunda]MBS4198622.1 hypothetical protein [Lederbergia citrisecunda]